MAKRIILVCLLTGMVALILVAASCNALQDIPCNVAGQLLNEAGQGQGFIAVQLVDVETGKVITSENADDGGNYMFKGVEAGTYILKTVPIGGGELRNDCEEFKLLPGKTLTKNMTVFYEKK